MLLPVYEAELTSMTVSASHGSITMFPPLFRGIFRAEAEEELLADGLHAFRDAALQVRPTLAKEFRNGRLVPEFFFQTMHLDIQKDNALVYRYTFELCRRGTCRVCGCTETSPCLYWRHGVAQPCWWFDASETLCSHCAIPEIADSPDTIHAIKQQS